MARAPCAGAANDVVRQCALAAARRQLEQDAKPRWEDLNFVAEQVCNPLGGRDWKPLRGDEWIYAECGGGGDCFFHSVGAALRVPNTAVRAIAASGVTAENVDELLRFYRECEPRGTWDRGVIERLPDAGARAAALRAVVSRVGPAYQGDDMTMRLVASASDVGIVVLRPDGTLLPQLAVTERTRRVVALVYTPGHWCLAGMRIANDPYHRVQTTFSPWQLPDLLTSQFEINDLESLRGPVKQHFSSHPSALP